MQSFKGTIFHVWKANQPCRVYVSDGQVYFIRRAAGVAPGSAAVIGSQFGLVGGLAVGLAAARARRPEFVRDDDPTPPDQLVSKHAENFAIPVSEIMDSRFEPAGKYFSYGKNSGHWHFTRRGDAKETVVLMESPADASQAASLLGGVLGGGRSRTEPRGTDLVSESDLVTDVPLPPEQASVVNAIQGLTQLVGERAPSEWQKVCCEVRLVSPNNARPLEILIGDRPDALRPDMHPTTYQAAMNLARTLSPSMSTFPGLVIQMTRLDQEKWHINAKLMTKR